MPALDTLPPLFDDDETPLWRIFLDPRGRIDRRGYWLYGVVALLALAALANALLGIAQFPRDKSEPVINVLLTWPAVAISAKRWHDEDKSAWWVLVVFVPVLGWLWALAHNGFVRGTPGANRFGAAPAPPTQ